MARGYVPETADGAEEEGFTGWTETQDSNGQVQVRLRAGAAEVAEGGVLGWIPGLGSAGLIV